ncbi:Ribonuclease H2 subunit A [Rhodotorula toruloides]|nr:Ribonuclease H2 subunit A [Rhodotorula toruloides]
MAGRKRAALPSASRSASPSAEKQSRFHFPSVRRNEPLIDSYTYHSVDAERKQAGEQTGARKDANEAEEKRDVEGEWMLGVDEAGRGPALGPQVYGIAFCQLSYESTLKEMGFADSKTLTDPLREELFKDILEHNDDVKYAVTVMSPNDISMGMLRKVPYNLNAQSHDVTINLIREVVERGYKVKQCFVDTVGPAADYQAKLSSFFPTINFTVTSKADALFPIVSAASIVAKVTRDRILEEWCFAEPGLGGTGEGEDGEGDAVRVFGSGYPSDPKTVAWLQDNFSPIFGFPNVARFSWAPVKNALLKKGAASKWDDEPASIQKYFTGKPAGPEQAPLWKDFNLLSVGEF